MFSRPIKRPRDITTMCNHVNISFFFEYRVILFLSKFIQNFYELFRYMCYCSIERMFILYYDILFLSIFIINNEIIAEGILIRYYRHCRNIKQKYANFIHFVFLIITIKSKIISISILKNHRRIFKIWEENT